MKDRIRVVYVTSSRFKKEENEAFIREATLSNGARVDELFEFDIRPVPIQEILNVDLAVMVSAEVVSAYSQLKVPCIVEHAGLVFAEYADRSYPGGLTKPMWDTLKDRFVEETRSAGRSAIARAVVAYCDGMQVRTFVGERAGKIADHPRGRRDFYWDTVFVPDDDSGRSRGLRTSGKRVPEKSRDSRFGRHLADAPAAFLTAPPRLIRSQSANG